MRKLSKIAGNTIIAMIASCGNKQVSVSNQLFTATDELLAIQPEIMSTQTEFEMQCYRHAGLGAPINLPVSKSAKSVADLGGIFRDKQEALDSGYTTTWIDSDPTDPMNIFLDSMTNEDKKVYEELSVVEAKDTGTEKDKTCATKAYTILLGHIKIAILFSILTMTMPWKSINTRLMSKKYRMQSRSIPIALTT